MHIHVLCGGESTEHDISLRSAKSIINNLNKEKYEVSYTYITRDGKFTLSRFFKNNIENPEDLIQDINYSKVESISKFLEFTGNLKDLYIIPVIHGTTGEDGQIQGFLDTLGLKYIGNDLESSAICFNKALAKDIFTVKNIPQGKYFTINKNFYFSKENKKEFCLEILQKLGESVFVKPSRNGSSIGVSRANKNNILEAIEEAFKYDDLVLIEEDMPYEELEISVIGNNNPKASLAGSYSTQRDIFDYEAKYLDKNLIRNIPHQLSDEDCSKVRNLAIEAYRLIGCKGFARVDIFMGNNHDFYINEINTFPGMTPTSLSADLWKATNGINYSEFLDKIIEYAIERYKNA